MLTQLKLPSTTRFKNIVRHPCMPNPSVPLHLSETNIELPSEWMLSRNKGLINLNIQIKMTQNEFKTVASVRDGCRTWVDIHACPKHGIRRLQEYASYKNKQIMETKNAMQLFASNTSINGDVRHNYVEIKTNP